MSWVLTCRSMFRVAADCLNGLGADSHGSRSCPAATSPRERFFTWSSCEGSWPATWGVPAHVERLRQPQHALSLLGRVKVSLTTAISGDDFHRYGAVPARALWTEWPLCVHTPSDDTPFTSQTRRVLTRNGIGFGGCRTAQGSGGYTRAPSRMTDTVRNRRSNPARTATRTRSGMHVG